MKRMPWILALLPFLALGCDDGSKTAQVVQAATKGAAEVGQQLAEKASALAGMTPEEAKGKLQELLDTAARELGEIRDSEAARRLAAEVQRILEQLGDLATRLGEKLDLAGLRTSIQELVQRFKDDPRVVSALESLRAKIDTLTR